MNNKIKHALALGLLSLCNMFAYADKVVTSKYVVNPSFEKSTDGWTISDLKTQTNNSFTKKAGNTYLEKWTDQGKAVGSASAQQTLKNLPAGTYKLSAAAQNIQQNNTADQTGAYIFAGPTTNNTPVTKADTYTIEFSSTGDDVVIGFKAVNASGNWIAVDNFKLTYVSTDLEQVAAAVSTAESFVATTEKSTNVGLQPAVKQALTDAIEKCKQITEETSAEDIYNAVTELAETLSAARENNEELKALKTLNNKAISRLKSDMAGVYLDALQVLSDQATQVLAFQDDSKVSTIVDKLQKAYDAATDSYTAKSALKKAINTATRLSTNGKDGAEELAAAIQEAETIRDDYNATPEAMTAAATAMDSAVLAFHIANATGSDPKATTLSVVQGATIILARGSFTGATREKGFCWSENPEPTVLDNRVIDYYDGKGATGIIYEMANVKPATVYYVRAYSMTTGYKVAYGNVVKVVTRPLGNATYNYDYAGDDATNERIVKACEEAVWFWNNVTGLKNFTLSAHYVPGAGAGGGTADCSYGENMRISQTVSYQKTGTVLHEGAHGQGMVNYTDWVNPIYRSNGDRGEWLGPRVDRVIQFLDNNPTAQLHGDYQHMWPFGINGAQEDTGEPMLYRGNALLIGALAEDGIRTPNQDFLKPAYSFVQDDNARYYIKSESPTRGIGTSYLCQKAGSSVRFVEQTADEAFANDSCAWYISFNPSTCYYTFKNVATGRYLNMSTGSATAATSQTNAKFQLLGHRQKTTFNDYTFAGTSYWIVNSSNHNAMSATATGASSANFDHRNDATLQRWLILSAEEVAQFADAQGETVGISQTKQQAKGDIVVAGGHGTISIAAVGHGQNVNIFTLDGRLVKRLYVQADAQTEVSVPRGLYVANGKKVLVR